jgi:hypothetical protein
MRQRGRISAAELATINVDSRPPRLDPPADLSDDERSLFTELVADCAPEHFVASDRPLLTSYVQATLMSRRAAVGMINDPDQITTFEKAVKLQAVLATRLRLAPQARTDPKTVARHAPSLGPKPWEIRGA